MNSQKSKGQRVLPLCLHSFPHPASSHNTPTHTHYTHTAQTHCIHTLHRYTYHTHCTPHIHYTYYTPRTPHIDTHMLTMPCTHHTHTPHIQHTALTLYRSHILHRHVRHTHVYTPHTYYTHTPTSPYPTPCTHIHPTRRVHFCAIILWMLQIPIYVSAYSLFPPNNAVRKQLGESAHFFHYKISVKL